MKLVIDSKIPFIRGCAERLGEAVYIDGAAISAADVRDADALIVRTRTRCDANLLEGAKVRFIATATIGYDHLDTDFLKKSGIAWANCPGCNAASVAQYVRNALLLLAAHDCWTPDAPLTPAEAPAGELDRDVFKQLTLGIVGVGHVGSQVLRVAKEMGFKRIFLCDPPREEREEDKTAFSSLDELAREADIVTFHTPLTHAGKGNAHPTYHLAGEEFFSKLRKGTVVFNTSRGEVVDTFALKRAMETERVRAAVIDTWENEPRIDRELLRYAFLSTPHIAGYSADGKANGTRMALEAVARFFGKDFSFTNEICPPALPPHFAYYPEGSGHKVAEELRLYDPVRDSLALKQNPDAFERLRGNYPLRREQ